MKPSKLSVLICALSFVFMGCPYESKVPVDSISNAKVDLSLLGKWEEKGEVNYEWNVTLEKKIYKITKKATIGEVGSEGDIPSEYNGFLSDVNGIQFFNIWENTLDSSARKYFIYQLEKRGASTERIKLKGMTSNVTKEFASSSELKAFIIKYMELDFFWNKEDEKTFYKN